MRAIGKSRLMRAGRLISLVIVVLAAAVALLRRAFKLG
jgi:hypothetical protein